MHRNIQRIFLIMTSCFAICCLPAQAAKMNDEYYMQKAIEMAKQNPNAPFGAVIVDNTSGEIIATGVNNSTVNPTFHGEMVALNHAAEKHPHLDWKNLTLYTTAEPCSMCQSAIVWTGISRVVFATSLAYLTSHGWDQINISAAEVNAKSPFYKGTLDGGVLAEKTNVMFNQ